MIATQVAHAALPLLKYKTKVIQFCKWIDKNTISSLNLTDICPRPKKKKKKIKIKIFFDSYWLNNAQSNFVILLSSLANYRLPRLLPIWWFSEFRQFAGMIYWWGAEGERRVSHWFPPIPIAFPYSNPCNAIVLCAGVLLLLLICFFLILFCVAFCCCYNFTSSSLSFVCNYHTKRHQS